MIRTALLPVCLALFVSRMPAQTMGDATAGERIFAGKGNCISCHMVRGRGGVLGPDLSRVGRDRNPAQIEQALRDPGSAPAVRGTRRGAPASSTVTVRLRDGQVIRGIAKNESTFDLQVLGTDNRLHLLMKSQVAEVAREKSLMPKTELNADEMRDLV